MKVQTNVRAGGKKGNGKAKITFGGRCTGYYRPAPVKRCRGW